MQAYRKFFVLFFFSIASVAKPCTLLGDHQPNEETGPFLVNDYGASGMFAVFGGALGVLDLYDRGNYAGIKIDFSTSPYGSFYSDPEMGSNWWEYFFEPICIGNENAPHYVFDLNDHLFYAGKGFHMPRIRAFELIQKYIHVKPHIQEKVDEFVQNFFDDYFVIGVHHRGTDKITEMALVSYEKTKTALNTVIASLTDNQRALLRIYVATDDAHFLTDMLDSYPYKIVYSECVRSDDNRAVHWGDDSRFESNYKKGEEALLDCLLLSRCNYLIRPWSSLSIMSDHFNPDIPLMTLSGD